MTLLRVRRLLAATPSKKQKRLYHTRKYKQPQRLPKTEADFLFREELLGTDFTSPDLTGVLKFRKEG